MRRLLPFAWTLVACSSGAAPASPPPVVAPAVAAPVVEAPAVAVPPPEVAPPPSGEAATPPAPRVRAEGFDVRATMGEAPISVLHRGSAREPTSEGESDDFMTVWRLGPSDGAPVRIVVGDTVCDGTLGERTHVRADYLDVESDYRSVLADEVVGCAGRATLAILHPTVGAPWPAPLEASDAAAATAIAAARAAVAPLAHGAPTDAYETRSYRLDANVYAVAWGTSCADDEEEACTRGGAAVVIVEPGQAPRTLIARPVHYPWDDTSEARYEACGIMDVDGDGAIEFCESMTSQLGTMVRLIRPSTEHRAGEMVWRMEERAEYTLPSAGPAPAPLAPPG